VELPTDNDLLRRETAECALAVKFGDEVNGKGVEWCNAVVVDYLCGAVLVRFLKTYCRQWAFSHAGGKDR